MNKEELSKHETRIYYGAYQSNKLIKSIECTLGIDSTEEERSKAKQKQLVLLSKIKELDELKYDILKKVI